MSRFHVLVIKLVTWKLQRMTQTGNKFEEKPKPLDHHNKGIQWVCCASSSCPFRGNGHSNTKMFMCK